MRVPVLTAVTGSPWEADLVAALERAAGGVQVVRRCLDLPDLLAAAAAGTGRAALLSADLRRLDRDALARLAVAGVVPVGLVTPGDEGGSRRLRVLGVRHVLPADASPDVIAAAVAAAIAASDDSSAAGSRSYADPHATQPPSSVHDASLPPVDGPTEDQLTAGAADGRFVAVWGPTGAPGRTTVATAVAGELAAAGVETLLADADVYGGVVGQVLGLLDDVPGLAAAARLAGSGSLDREELARFAPYAAPRLRVLTGIPRADRWPELRPSSLEPVWSLARTLAAVTVVDCGFSLEQDEELSFDSAAPRRNGATLLTLEHADLVLAVGAADPVGVQRLVRGLTQLHESVPGAVVRVVLNGVRRSAVGAEPEQQLREALERYAGVHDAVLVPYDREGCDRALLLGRTLPEAVPGSPARLALAGLAAEVGEGLLPSGRRSRRRDRRARAPG